MANKPKDKSVSDTKAAKPASKPKQMSEVDRNKLNDKARFDYGIVNASDMSEAQVKAEIAAIDKQGADARKADAKS